MNSESAIYFANRSNVRCKRGSNEQKAHLLNYLQSDPDFAHDRYEGVEGRRIQNEKWMNLATQLNNIPGARKNGQEWRKYWRDLVLRTKTRAQEIHANINKSSIERKIIKPLSAEELQIIEILTPDEIKKRSKKVDYVSTATMSSMQIPNDPNCMQSTQSYPNLPIEFRMDCYNSKAGPPPDMSAVDYVLNDTDHFNTPDDETTTNAKCDNDNNNSNNHHHHHLNNPHGSRKRSKKMLTRKMFEWAEKKFANIEMVERKKLKILEEKNDLLREIVSNLKGINANLNHNSAKF